MARSFVLSGFIGVLTALAGWAATLVILGSEATVQFQGRSFEWPDVIVAATGVLVLFVIVAMHRVVDPILTIAATGAGCALLWNLREFPVASRTEGLAEAGPGYWTIVVAMVLIFMVLAIALRQTSNANKRR